ncbi:Peptide-N(4)-(N-acetyl-beta-glucosaminyl)asparagine amidase [Eufriesea mexicana]|uniref:Peptide-N(4)-(N-acetyl-beta-glucosaminyl)asparagine amidase n=1 Tax=Eufriesea mexicana TaxID=516756 RepID=A0A310SD32_9HYME|nr:Peptide-N(4)-(N-acetyl-beta-glucosaminyl)asparagine amidase [Eufriesea mexicana]
MDKNLLRSLDLLKENEKQIRNDAEHALLTVCQNILAHPNNKQYREVKLDHPIVTAKLLPALGAIECLFDIGFVETTDCLSLPQEAPLSKLQALQNLLNKSSRTKISVKKNATLYNLLPPTSLEKEKKLFKFIIYHFQSVLRYEDASLQEKAKKVIPIVDLEIATMTRIRQLHKHVKLHQTCPTEGVEKQYSEDDIDAKDLFLMELLHWFKYKFFTWVDSPKCTACFLVCEKHEVILSDDPRCSKIEIHKCTNCGTLVKFPRYSDPEPLLTRRRGRCGEWANVFTLFCRTLGYDARIIHDRTDHVWTEVCNGHCPYINGKYVQRQYVIKRRLLELAELIYVPNQQDSDDDENYKGRSTGSYEWRLARGEISKSSSKIGYSWDISKYGESFHLQYSIVKDIYTITDNDGKILMDMSDWQNGVDEIEGGMFRKVEYDWKIVYLSRSLTAISGNIKWCFVVENPNLYIRTFHLQATIKEFKTGNVSWKIEAFFDNANQNKSVVLPISDCSDYSTDQLKGTVKLILTATVFGGEDDQAWQHAQLFRQSLETKDDRSLVIDIELENR